MNAESRALVDRAREEVHAADLLLDGELFLQVAPRAYQAMFYTAEALLANEGLDYSSEAGQHAAFGQLLVKFGGVDPGFHGHLLTAFRQQQAVTYHRPSAQASPEHARELLAQAREFVEMAESYLRGQSGVEEDSP